MLELAQTSCNQASSRSGAELVRAPALDLVADEKAAGQSMAEFGLGAAVGSTEIKAAVRLRLRPPEPRRGDGGAATPDDDLGLSSAWVVACRWICRRVGRARATAHADAKAMMLAVGRSTEPPTALYVRVRCMRQREMADFPGTTRPNTKASPI